MSFIGGQLAFERLFQKTRYRISRLRRDTYRIVTCTGNFSHYNLIRRKMRDQGLGIPARYYRIVLRDKN